jgi:nucleoside-diphosphate kinase
MIKTERSYVMIKHDGIQRNLVGEITSRFERAGLKLVGIKMFVPDLERATAHYGKPDEWCEAKGQKYVDMLNSKGITPEKPAIEYGRDIVRALLKYITCGPVVAMVWEGNRAVDIVKKLVGGTEPTTSDVGTIRGDFTLDSYGLANTDNRAVRNLIHCTGEVEEADFEINLWFKQEELISYRHINEAMLYDVNLDSIME